MENDFATKIQAMLDEVRDLKTIHRRGLGTTKFYRRELEIYANPNTTYTFVVRIADGEPDNPILIPLMNTEAPTWSSSISFNPSTTAGTSFSVGTGPIPEKSLLKVAVISSSQIGEFRQA